MSELANLVESFINENIPILGPVAILACLVCIGFALLGPRAAKDWAKAHVFYLIIGAALIFAAASIANSIVSSFGF